MDMDQKVLVNELRQGRELASQLKMELEAISMSSPETRAFLLDQILSTYEKALSVLNWSALLESQNPPLNPNSDSPNSHSGDTTKEDEQNHKDVLKKRKLNLTKWSEKVNISSAKGNFIDDGHSWRKYGQKDILGANFPRAYYRCAHRPSQGCLATKQVQKSDEDSSIVEISYKGTHTCTQSYRKPKTEEENTVNFPQQPKQEEKVETKTKEILFNFQPSYKTNDFVISNEDIFQFTFPHTPFGSEITENELFSSSRAFISPATSGSNFFSSSAYDVNNLGLTQNYFQSSDSDLGEIFSSTDSVSNSPCENLDYLIDQVDFDSSLPLDIF
jgi:hypothetical protein